MERKIRAKTRGRRTQDGAGVRLVRVLGNDTVQEFDPVLMLDSFDSVNPDDYKAGFPLHPHRGIETISYVCRGWITHRDSLGNTDKIGNGEVQWMTAGSGILHEERLPAADRLLGVQLWLNLPAKNKMTDPAYHSIKNQAIQEIALENGQLRLLAGEYEGRQGFMSLYLPLDYYDLHLNPNASVVIPTARERSVMIFTLVGDAYIGDERVQERTAAQLTPGDHVKITAAGDPVQVLFISSISLSEPVAWGGPIVMNTRAELNQAFAELNDGTFIKSKITY
jgi:quercetin 2,3-dioxygenase